MAMLKRPSERLEGLNEDSGLSRLMPCYCYLDMTWG